MKKTLFLATTCALLAQGAAEAKHIVLTSPILELIDGKSYALNGVVFGLLLQVRKEDREMMYGKKNADGNLEGLYTFDGKKVCIIDLVEIEKEVHASGDQVRIVALQKLLDEIKEDFIEVTQGYVTNIRPFKNQILVLIEESCKQHNKTDSFLLKWADELDGEEGKMLREDILNFEDFKQFCFDLATYLEDMAYSCPKAKKLFLEMIKQKRSQAS